MFFKPEDLYAAGQTGSDLVKGLASEVAKSVCGLYQDYPRSFGISNPAGDAVSALTSGVMDSFCSRLPEPQLPGVPSIPFSGGQCCSYSYRAVGTYTRQFQDLNGNLQGEPQTGIPYSILLDPGKVLGVRINNTQTGVEATVQSCSGVSNTRIYFNDGQYRISSLTVSISVFEGGADNCGDLPAEYPEGMAPTSNPGTYPHVGGDGIPRPINFDINFPGGGGFPSISFPDFPNLNIPVKIDATGIDIDIPIGIGNNTNNNGGLTDDNLEDLLAGAKAATRGARAGNRATDGGGDNEGGTGEDGIEGLYGVYFDAVTIPTWFGKVFGSPLKYRLGRISFKRDGYHLRDEDILFAKQYFVAPADANGYVATYEPEVVGKITVIREIQE